MMHICNDDLCTICGQDTESIDNLMFNCTYSNQCIERAMGWLGIHWCNRSLTQLCRWVRDKYIGTKIQRGVVIAMIVATVYHIWSNRNIA